MIFPKKDVVTTLHETSKTTKGTCLLEMRYKQEVYHFDKIKELICAYYRDSGETLKSCDAYYEDSQNFLAIEFKNTPHKNLKPYFKEICTKAFDTHMLLNETFWKKRKKKISSKVNFIVVYNDALNDGDEIHTLNNNFNHVTPLSGSKERKSKSPEYYFSEEEYQSQISEFISAFESEFYQDVQFMDKEEFIEYYIDTSYFSELEPNEIIA